jgi:hypothetical protein
MAALAALRSVGHTVASTRWELVSFVFGLLSAQLFVYGLRYSFTTGAERWRARVVAAVPVCSVVLGVVAIQLQDESPASRPRLRRAPSREAPATGPTELADLAGPVATSPGSARRHAGGSASERDYAASLAELEGLGGTSRVAPRAGPSRPFAGLLAELRRRKAARELGLERPRVAPTEGEIAELSRGGERRSVKPPRDLRRAVAAWSARRNASEDGRAGGSSVSGPRGRDLVVLDERQLRLVLLRVAAQMAGPAPDLSVAETGAGHAPGPTLRGRSRAP